MIESKGLETENLGLNALMFYNKDVGFIAGSSDIVTHNPDFPEKDSNQFAFVAKTALLYKTTDAGRIWGKKDFGEGSFTDIIQAGSKIFAIKSSKESKHSFTYSSDDLGANWKEEKSFPQKIGRLFSIDSGYLAVTSDSSLIKTYIQVSRNFGRSWSISESNLLIFDAVMRGRKLFYLSSNQYKDYRKNLLVEYSLGDSTKKVIKLPNEFDCYFLTNYNNEIKLSGLKDGHLAVYSLDKDNQVKYEYSYLKENTYFPQGYYNNKEEEWIIAGKRGDADVSNKILKTRDNGKSWEVVSFEKEKYIKPFYFLNANDKVKAWFYAGSGKFQIME